MGTEDYIFVYALALLLGSIVFGFVCKAIASGRGMHGGFWWGFFLWAIGVIVVAVRPNENQVNSQQQNASSPYEDLERLANLKSQGVISDDEYDKLKATCLSRMK